MAVVAVTLHEHLSVGLALGLAGLGLFAGWLGAVVGIGGGVVVVPTLVLAFGFDTKVAVAASLVAVVATSIAAGGTYVGKGQVNIRLALVLEIATTIGGLVGGLVAVVLASSVLDGLFAVVMLVTAALVFRGRRARSPEASAPGAPHATEDGGSATRVTASTHVPAEARAGATRPQDLAALEASPQPEPGTTASIVAMADAEQRVGWEEQGHLAGGYHDQASGIVETYRAVRLWLGWLVSFLAGLLSGLLGVGGGFLKVPAMNLGMKVPIKVSAATSNLMIGVTATASLFVYFAHGYVLPFVATPIALGIAVGAYAGAHSAQRVSSRALAVILAAVLVVVAVQMGLRATGVFGG